VTFGASAPWSLGVEEELFLVDAETLEPAPLFSEVVPQPGARLKAEVFACLVETTTPICADADEVLAQLVALRREVVRRAAEHGATILAAGTHPTARGAEQPVIPEPRYLDLAAKLGADLSRQLVCGLHVHVGMPDADTCLRAYEGIVPWLPTLLALSANSPFEEGCESGLRSVRAGRLAQLPTGGPPPMLRTWADWEAATGDDYTRRHWDVRPHPLLGTLEVRIVEQQTDVRRSAAFASLVQALAVSVAERDVEPYDRGHYMERRARAAAEPPDREELERLAELVGPRTLFEEPTEAECQLDLGLPAALRDLAQRSLQWPA
jgi:carboxylate-amine ligase